MYRYFSLFALSLFVASTLLVLSEPFSAYAVTASFPSFCNGNTYTSNYNTVSHNYYYGRSTNYNSAVYVDASPYDVHIDVISNNSVLNLTSITDYSFMFYPSSVDVPDQLNIIAASAFTVCIVPQGYLTPVPNPSPVPSSTPAPTSLPSGCITIPTYDTDGYSYWRTIISVDSSYDGWFINTLIHPVDVVYNTTGASVTLDGYNIPIDTSVETTFTLFSYDNDIGVFLCPSATSTTPVPTPTYTGVGIPSGCVTIPTYDSDGSYWRTIVSVDSSYDGWYINTFVHPVDVFYNTSGVFLSVSGYNIPIDTSVETSYTLTSMVSDLGVFICPSAITEPTTTPVSGGSGGLTSAQIKAAVRDVLTSGTALPITAPSPATGLATPVPLTTPVPNMSTSVALLCSKEPCYSGSTVLAGMGTLGEVLSLGADAADCTTLSFTLGSGGFVVGGASMTESVCAFLDWSTSIRYYTRTFSLLIFGFILFRYVQLTIRRVGDV